MIALLGTLSPSFLIMTWGICPMCSKSRPGCGNAGNHPCKSCNKSKKYMGRPVNRLVVRRKPRALDNREISQNPYSRISEHDRHVIVYLGDQGYCQSDVAQLTEVSRQSVGRIWKNYDAKESVADQPRAGRPVKLRDETKQDIVEYAKKVYHDKVVIYCIIHLDLVFIASICNS